jgi:DNA-binding transcriptional LysR family regulator
VLAGELDAALVVEPVADAPFDKAPVYVEELVIVAAAGHRPIKTARDADTRTVLAFEPGCSHRQRLEDWFARSGEMPERIIDMSSYHAILGCAVARMGIALMPKSVLATFPDIRLLSVHSLPSGLNTSQTVMIWRKGAQSPKVSALLEILAGKPSQPARRGRRRN